MDLSKTEAERMPERKCSRRDECLLLLSLFITELFQKAM